MKYNFDRLEIEVTEEDKLEQLRINKLYETKGFLESIYDEEFKIDTYTESILMKNLVLISIDDDNETLMVSFSNECSPTESALLTARLMGKYEVVITENFFLEGEIFFGEEADLRYGKHLMTKCLNGMNYDEDDGICKFVKWR
jgi:hypothetical protein